tara:strand:+ start:2159 stop:2542 length:384 start_codon:yes stop_codon:yes gene_type:complete
MGKRASKKEMETRVSEAAELVLQGQAYSLITSHVAEKYSISRRQARRITADAYLLLKNDIEEADLNKPEMTAKLVNVLENAMFQAMEKKQYAAVGTNAKVLMRLIGLDTQEVNHQHRFKHGRSSAYY